MTRPEKKKILVLVKTYPNPSTRYTETVCVAGVLMDAKPSWIRLYPIPFRDLPKDQQFKKYDVIEADITKNKEDFRPESFKVFSETISTVGKLDAKYKWEKRKEAILPLCDKSMCDIQKESATTQKSLGIFKPRKIIDLSIQTDKLDWTSSQKEILSQISFLNAAKKPLEKVPFKFKFKYECLDESCPGHNQGIIDWEIYQLYRNLKSEDNKETLIKKIKNKYMGELCGPKKDPYFIVGNQKEGPKSFMILSVFHPPKDDQLKLFSNSEP